MRYNRKACQRAIKLAAARDDMRVIPFGLAFHYLDQHDERRIGTRKVGRFDDRDSVEFGPAWLTDWNIPLSSYQHRYILKPGLKPPSLKKHELRKQARDLRRMKQYD